MKTFTLIILFVFLFFDFVYAQESEEIDQSLLFLQPEVLIGKTLPANSNFPETRLQTVFSLSFGKYAFNPRKDWAVYYNYPMVGLSFSKSSFGNDAILGSAYTLMPFITFNTSKRIKNSIQVKLGLGGSYFTKHFDKESNPNNKAIGSTFTWTFTTSLHYNFISTKYFTFNIGAAYIHHSNGHAQLPNLGLNSFLASLSSVVFLKPLNRAQLDKYQKSKVEKSKHYFINVRNGIGVHELGDTDTYLARVKKPVYIFSIGVGLILKQLFKIKAGFTYRFYNHYYSYILENEPADYIDKPVLNASNIFLYGGFEFLIGHIGIDAELGVNLYKPFYKEHSSRFENESNTSYALKSTFASRLGLKFYLISTAKNPRNNVFLGAHINANLGQADFSELSFGYIHVFK